MIQPHSSPGWESEQQRWSAWYAERLPQQLRDVAAHVRVQRRTPGRLVSHFASCLSLLRRTAAFETFDEAWLALVEALHPLPKRWGQWEAWLEIMKLAAMKHGAREDCAEQARYLGHAAALLLEMGRLEMARQTAEKALALAIEAGASVVRLEVSSTLAAVLSSSGRYEEAAECLEALPRFEDVSDLDAATLVELERMDLLRHQGDPLGALAAGSAVLQRLYADDDNDPYLLAVFHRRLATIQWAAGAYEDAATNLQRAAALFSQAGDALAAVLTEGNLGLVYYSMARYEQAERAIEAALAAGEQLGARWWIIRDMGNRMAVYLARGQLELALFYGRRFLDLAHEFQDAAEISRARANYGATLLYMGQPEEGLVDIEAGLAAYRAHERSEGYIASKVDLALCLQAMGKQKEAVALAQKAYEEAAELDFPALRIITARCLAEFAPAAERAALLREALDLARQVGRPLDEAGCLLSLASLDGGDGRMWQAGKKLLEQIGAAAWLKGRSPADPPLVALIL